MIVIAAILAFAAYAAGPAVAAEPLTNRLAAETPRKGFVDENRPGGNALAALVLERLYGLTNDPSYRTLARGTLTAFPLSAHRLGGRRP